MKKNLILICVMMFTLLLTHSVSARSPILVKGFEIPSISTLDTYEPNDTPVQATGIIYGNIISAALETHDDVPFYEDKDYYRFSAFHGESLIINVDADYTGSDLWPRLCLISPIGTELSCDYGTQNSEIVYSITGYGEYFLRIDAYCGEGGSGCRGSYELGISSDYPFESNDSISEATLRFFGNIWSGTINGHNDVPFWLDEDYYKFHAFAGESLVASINVAEYPASDLLPEFCLLDAIGAELVCELWTQNDNITYSVSDTGYYYLKIDAPCGEGGAWCSGPYELNLSSDYPYEPNDSIGEATNIRYGDILSATINGHDGIGGIGDIDFYQFHGFSGETLEVKVEAPDSPVSVLWTTICLLDTNGLELTCEGFAQNNSIIFTLFATDTYFLSVDGDPNPYTGNHIGPYELSLSSDFPHEPNDTPDLAVQISNGDIVSGTINGHTGIYVDADKDYYEFQVIADEIIEAQVNAPPHPDSYLRSARLCLIDEVGAELTCEGFSEDPAIMFAATMSGTHYLRVDVGACGISGFTCSGPYTLNLTVETGESDLYKLNLPIITHN